MMQQSQSRPGSGNPRSDSAKNTQRKHPAMQISNLGSNNPQASSGSGATAGLSASNKLKGRIHASMHQGGGNAMAAMAASAGIPGTMIAGSKGLNAKALQQNYMRGYSPSKPLWK